MIENFESLLAGEMMYDAEREQGGLPVQGVSADPMTMTEQPKMDVAIGAGRAGRATLREILTSLRNIGRTKTDDILDRLETPPENVMSPKAMNDIEQILGAQTVRQDELSGAVPIAAKDNMSTQQDAPKFQPKPLKQGEMLKAMQSGDVPQDKLTPSRSYNIERHHEGARAAINKTFQQIEDANDMAKVLDFIAENTGKKGTRTFEQIRAKVKTPEDIFYQLKDVFGGTQKGLLTDEQNYAARVLTSSIFQNYKRTAKTIGSGDDAQETLLQLAQMEEQLNFMIQYVSNNASETARALSSHRMIAQTLEGGSLEDMSRVLDQVGGVQDLKMKAKLVNLLDEQTPEQGDPAVRFIGYLARTIRKVTTPAVEYWRAQILSSPKTHIVNLTGTVMQNMWDNMLIRPTAAMIGEGRKGLRALLGKETPDYVSWQETLAANASSLTSMMDAYRMMYKAFRENEGRFTGTVKGGEENVGAFENVAKFMFGDKAGGAVSNVALAPYRFLGAEDELGKVLGYRQELSAQAIRQAIRENLDGAAMWKRAEELINMPTPDMHAKAMEFAKRTTFQDDINGPILGGFVRQTKQAINMVPELGFIIPFVETPTNVVRRLVELAPVANVASSRLRKQWMAGGAERDLANAKVLWGIGLGVMFWQLYDAGIITGPGPAKWEVKEAKMKEGWQPNAIRIGDKQYSVDRLAPFGQAMAAVTGLLDQAKYAGTEAEFQEIISTYLLVMADNVTEMPFMQGFNTLIEAAKGEPYKMRSAAGSIPAGFVPYSALVRDIKNIIDPTQYTVTEDNQAQAGFFEFMKQNAMRGMPFLSANLRPARYWDGTVKRPQVGEVAYSMLPFKVGKAAPERDKANVELILNQVPIGEPKPIVSFAGVEFSLAELDSGAGKIYDAYIVKVGELRREIFDELVNSEDYQKQEDIGPDSIRASMLISAEAKVKQAALYEFVEQDLKGLLEQYSENLSDIGKELNNKETIEAWVNEILATYAARREQDKNFEKSVRLRGKAKALHPRKYKDLALDPLH